MAAQRFRGRGDERTAGRKRGEKPPGGFKDRGAVLFSRKRLIEEASARTGAPLPPASRIHPRLPAADPPHTHPSCAASPRQAERAGAAPGAHRWPRRSPPEPHGLFGFIHRTAHRSLASGPRKDRVPPPRLRHPPRTRTAGTSRGSGMAAPGCRPHGPGAPPPARQMVNYIHSRILRWDRVSDNEPVLFD